MNPTPSSRWNPAAIARRAAVGFDSWFRAYPPGFRPLRGINWIILGAMYASFYMCRYNFRWAAPGMSKEFGFDEAQISDILSATSIAYGTGQLINGLFCDRIGGRASMLIGAAGTIAVNLFFGFSSFVGTFSTVALIWLMNGYFQSFGAPGMVKINAAWFNRSERGTFAGIFGLMIQLGQVAINNLAPIILAGFAIGAWVVAKNDWRWLFCLPPIVTAVLAVLVAFIPRESPEQAGFTGVIHDEVSPGDAGVRVSLKESFLTIFRHPLVWLYALAYACTGAVRHSSDQLAPLFFVNYLGLDLSAKPSSVKWTMGWIVPLIAVLGSFISGVVSDKLFKGHRSPVAMWLYAILSVVCLVAAGVMFTGAFTAPGYGIWLSCLFLILVSFSVNATHSLVGTAAPMDIGGRRMAGFASGVIDSFQYYGAAIGLSITGRLIKYHGWTMWYPTMVVFAIMGVAAMVLVMRKQKLLAKRAAATVN
jgi:MFS transporter, OPA family, glycerol-3-phosphate transporter